MRRKKEAVSGAFAPTNYDRIRVTRRGKTILQHVLATAEGRVPVVARFALVGRNCELSGMLAKGWLLPGSLADVPGKEENDENNGDN